MSLQSVIYLWERNFLVFRKTWLLSFLWVFMEPILVYLALAFGMGSFISSVHGVPYAEFFFPGLMAVSVMLVSFFVSTYENFSKLTSDHVYSTQLLAPVDPDEIFTAEILWACSKATLTFLAVAMVGLVVSVVKVSMLPALYFVSMLLAVCFSSFGMWVTSKVQSYEQIIYPTSCIIIPMSLFCGTYFPIEELPLFFHASTYFFPLTYGVKALREIVSPQGGGGTNWMMFLGLLVVLLAFSTSLFLAARRKFRGRLSSN